MLIAVIYDPKAEKRRPGLPFGTLGDREFFYLVTRLNPGRKKGEEEILLKPVCLKSGTNFLEAQEWQNVLGLEVNAKEIQALVRDRVLTVYEPDSEANDITAFADEDAVTEIIENTNDRDRLDLWLRVENRTGDNDSLNVRKLIADRIHELDELAKERKGNASGQLF